MGSRVQGSEYGVVVQAKRLSASSPTSPFPWTNTFLVKLGPCHSPVASEMNLVSRSLALRTLIP